MKKKRIILILLVISGSILSFSFYHNSLRKNEETKVIENKNDEKEFVSGFNALAIMLENEDGQYVLTDTDTWPTDGYVFNPDLSKCENGGTLSWNDGKITLKTSGSDKCYAYFSKKVVTELTSAIIDSDFSSSCQISASYNNGQTWEQISFPMVPGQVLELTPGTLLKVEAVDSRGFYLQCGINICSSTDCDSGDEVYFDKCAKYVVNSNNSQTYKTLEGKYFYSLAYCHCLTGNNDIWVEEKKKRRKKKVNELKKGDLILVYDEDKKKIVTEKIKDIVINKINIIYKIYLNDGSMISCSANHLFMAKDFGAITAQEIKKSYELLDALGNYQKVENIEIENNLEGVEVYSIIIEKKGKKYFILNKCLILTLSFAFDILTVSAAEPCTYS